MTEKQEKVETYTWPQSWPRWVIVVALGAAVFMALDIIDKGAKGTSHSITHLETRLQWLERSIDDIDNTMDKAKRRIEELEDKLNVYGGSWD